MRPITRRLVRSLAAVLGLPSLLLLVIGFQLVGNWTTTQTPDRFYVPYPYLQESYPWLMVGVWGLLGSGAILIDPSRSKQWLWLPVVAMVFALVWPTYVQYGHTTSVMGGDPVRWGRANIQRDIERQSPVWWRQAEKRGRFLCPPDTLPAANRFGINGRALPYEMQCAELDTFMDLAAPKRPGVIVMALSADGQEAWWRVTTLGHEPAQPVVWLSAGQEHAAWTVHHTLGEKPISPLPHGVARVQ
ncbi:hypothetical protein YTPLAS18_31760 [Nitrospira sp.]|nr:hypothetical protein YTPLAS18_31760 [Nitrospira sp.]